MKEAKGTKGKKWRKKRESNPPSGLENMKEKKRPDDRAFFNSYEMTRMEHVWGDEKRANVNYL